jgi:type IV pilus assembly protein PilV
MKLQNLFERSRRRQQHGVTLIEVLVAILITATGVLGAAALQLNSVKFNQVANVRSAAVFLANDMADRIRANRAAALNGFYDLAMDDSAPKGAEVYQIDHRDWLNELVNRLPGGDGSVVRDGTTFTITVQWQEGRLERSRLAAAGDTESFVFVTEL